MGVHSEVYINLNIKETPKLESIYKILEILKNSLEEKFPEFVLLSNISKDFEFNYYEQSPSKYKTEFQGNNFQMLKDILGKMLPTESFCVIFKDYPLVKFEAENLRPINPIGIYFYSEAINLYLFRKQFVAHYIDEELEWDEREIEILDKTSVFIKLSSKEVPPSTLLLDTNFAKKTVPELKGEIYLSWI